MVNRICDTKVVCMVNSVSNDVMIELSRDAKLGTDYLKCRFGSPYSKRAEAERKMNYTEITVYTLCLCLLVLLSPAPAAAQTWNAFNAQMLYGAGFELEREKAETLTLEWINGWAYGDNFAFMDIRPLRGDSSFYGEWSPRLSFSKTNGKDFSAGPVGDVLLSGTLEKGEGFTNYLIGGGADLDVPGFNFVQTHGYLRENPDLSGTTWQVTVVWNATFETGPAHWMFNGYFDWAGSEGKQGTSAYEKQNFLMQPQLLLDAGRLAGRKERVYVGIEWWYWHNKFGIPGVEESVVQAMMRINL